MTSRILVMQALSETFKKVARRAEGEFPPARAHHKYVKIENGRSFVKKIVKMKEGLQISACDPENYSGSVTSYLIVLTALPRVTTGAETLRRYGELRRYTTRAAQQELQEPLLDTTQETLGVLPARARAGTIRLGVVYIPTATGSEESCGSHWTCWCAIAKTCRGQQKPQREPRATGQKVSRLEKRRGNRT
ncbi:hypothetical protein NDU88_002112 [Pleurodeles waltl]|uniref:Uncharacterized protein n=1 Tax=Pleurodeles waltl TaxID=8319 RepID=A0AAV7LCX1_PLEWA|nr:hypothetical protein NDU88_002112 [Pleurodeles waltl]